MKKLLKLLFVLAVYFSPTLPFIQGVTSSISGNVYDKEMLTLPGASILAVHTPSGTRYTASTDYTGNFSISNMRVGGPVTITFVGFSDFVNPDVYLQLGRNKTFKSVLSEESNQ
jgi:hypothetical protein